MLSLLFFETLLTQFGVVGLKAFAMYTALPVIPQAATTLQNVPHLIWNMFALAWIFVSVGEWDKKFFTL